MTRLLRAFREDDMGWMLDLNARHVALLAPLDEDRLRLLERLSDRLDVVETGGEPAGFVLTFAAGSAYDSENYRWFGERYDDFYYLDRIVLDEKFRRRGLATFVYDEVESVAARHRRMALEVNLVPPNEPSLAFHRARGYVEVGQLGDEGHRVALMEKPLTR